MISAGALMQSARAEEAKVQRNSASPTNSNAAPIRIPHAMAIELETDRKVIEAEKATAAELKNELQLAKKTLDAETAEVTMQEAAAEAMRMDVDAYRRRITTTDTHEVQRFNRSVKEYNVLASEAIEKRTRLNASIEQYNALVAKHQAQVALVNQLAEAHNAKLLRNGH